MIWQQHFPCVYLHILDAILTLFAPVMHRQSCLPSGLTVAAPDAFGRIPGVQHMKNQRWQDKCEPIVICSCCLITGTSMVGTCSHTISMGPWLFSPLCWCQWQCIASHAFIFHESHLFPLPHGAGDTVLGEEIVFVAATLSMHCRSISYIVLSRVLLAKQETLTPPGYLVSPLVSMVHDKSTCCSVIHVRLYTFTLVLSYLQFCHFSLAVWVGSVDPREGGY